MKHNPRLGSTGLSKDAFLMPVIACSFHDSTLCSWIFNLLFQIYFLMFEMMNARKK